MAEAQTAHHVSRETLQDRLRVARITTRRYDDGVGLDVSGDSRRLGRAIENLVNRIIEDGLEGEDEKDAYAEFHDAILIDIDRQMLDFADKIENEIRPARWAKFRQAAES
jgi:hypothetical protein